MHTPRSDDLLRRLGSGVRPSAVGLGADHAQETPDFQALLGSARRGELSTGRAVEIDHALGIDLTDEQHEEINRAADAAEAAGVHVLAAFVDDTALVVDVADRRTGEARALRSLRDDTPSLLTGIEAAVVLSPTPREESDEDTPEEALAPGLRMHGAGRIGSEALIRSLGRSSPSPATQLGDR